MLGRCPALPLENAMTGREGNGPDRSAPIEFEDLAHSVVEMFLTEIARRMVLTG